MKKQKLKNLLLFATLCLISAITMAQKTGAFTINGNIKEAKKLFFYKDGFRAGALTDSVITNDGKFTFKGTTSDILPSSVLVTGDNLYYIVDFFLEAGTINITKNGTSYSVTGTFDNNLANTFESQKDMLDSGEYIQPYYDGANRISEKLFHLRKEENPNDKLIKLYQDSSEYFESPIIRYSNWRVKKTLAFINQYPNTYVAANYISFVKSGMDTAAALKLYNRLGTKIQSGTIGKNLYKDIIGHVTLTQGTKAPDFTTTDVNGQKISLSDFKGKYALLDFWATWCGPCRAANPHLIALYNQYHDKGLEVIAIADDNTNVEGWKKAIKTDRTGIWHQILETSTIPVNGEKMKIGRAYNISYLPTQYLVDKEGNIISLVDGLQLEESLKKLMP